MYQLSHGIEYYSVCTYNSSQISTLLTVHTEHSISTRDVLWVQLSI